MTVRVPVLIVGAGAAGLATSALLAQHGIRTLLVEKRREVFIYPKARNLSFRSLEILRGLGLSDEVHQVADRRRSRRIASTTTNGRQLPGSRPKARCWFARTISSGGAQTSYPPSPKTSCAKRFRRSCAASDYSGMFLCRPRRAGA